MHDFSLCCDCPDCDEHYREQADDEAYRQFEADDGLGQVGMAEEYEPGLAAE